MKIKGFILINLNFLLAFQFAAFYRKHFEESSAVSDDHYEFSSARPHGGKFKELILASFDPDFVDDQTRFYLREVVDHLALGPAGHAHGQRKKLQKFSNLNQTKNHQERKRMKKNKKRARKFFRKHHRRNLL